MKTSLTVLAALVTVAGLSAPAFADSLGSSSSTEDDSFNNALVLQTLRDRGVDASAVEKWGDRVKATVTLADGSTTFEYYTINGLQPINSVGGGNTRVLTELDVGPRAAPQDSTQSLTWINPDDR